ncbi:hypothetical protein D6853_03335 [Butyrivibrio sp. X503]|uniref:hypothetical protein n=1 Tax=Butyrivibrio sp. X503 TaxID=2364878 RepID=UPI000EA89DD3|nr:hypothetical protein [Butyrivibrio sp. X503]RKM57064.1 hypothetical protein D6853_03335 [Butyrivibrio sp. X503]
MNHKKKRYLSITLISLVFFLACVLLGRLKYSTNDDTIMNLISAGAFGGESQYLVYNNIIFGYILKVLYTVIPGVNWYLWSYLIFNLLSVIAISAVITEGFSLSVTAFVTTALNMIFAYDFYTEIQFTQSSSFYAIAGGIILFSMIIRKKRNIPGIIVATIFVSMGVMARAAGAGIVLPFLGTACLFIPCFFKKELKNALITFALPLAAVVICLLANFYAYYVNPDWKYFSEWNNIMVEKCDHGNYNFNWDKEAYLEAGFTETDFQLLDMWVWNDTEYFNLDKLRTMQEIGEGTRKDKLRLDPEVFKYTFQKLAESPRYGASPVVFVLLVLTSLIFFKKRYKLLVLIQTLWVFVLYYVLTCSKRIMWRVESGIWLSAILFTVLFIIGTRAYKDSALYKLYDRFRKGFAIAALAVSVIAVAVFGCGQFSYFINEKNGHIAEEPDPTYEKVKAITEREGFYIVDVDTTYGDLCGARNIFDIDRKYLDYYENFCQIGGWIQPSPIGLYHANLNDIDNPIKSLIERDDVFYVGGGERAGYLYVFLNEKYGPGINMEMVDEVCGAPVWRYFR